MNSIPDTWYYSTKRNTLQTLHRSEQSIVISTRSLKYELDRNVYHNMAITHYLKQDYEKAAKSYAIMSVLKPNCTIVHNGWGFCLFHLGRYDEAISKFKKAVEINPKYILGYLNWGLCLYWKGEESEAEQIIEKGIWSSLLKRKILLERYESELLIVENKMYEEMDEEKREFLKGRACGYRWILELISRKFKELNSIDSEESSSEEEDGVSG